MKKSYKKGLALFLAVLMVVTTGLYSADGFLKATDGEDTQSEQQTEESTATEVQKVEIPADPEADKTSGEAEKSEPETKSEPAAAPAASDTQKSKSADKKSGTKDESGDKAKEDNAEKTYDVVIDQPSVDGGTIKVQASGENGVTPVNFNSGSFTKKVKDGAELKVEIKTADNYKVGAVKVNGSELKADSVNGKVSTYRFTVREDKKFTITYEKAQAVSNDNSDKGDANKDESKDDDSDDSDSDSDKQTNDADKKADASDSTAAADSNTNGSSDDNGATDTDSDSSLLGGIAASIANSALDNTGLQIASPLVMALFGSSDNDVENPKQTLTTTAGDGAKITVSAPEGALPAGSNVNVRAISSGAVETAVETAVNADGKELINFKAYDITITDKDGKVIQPESAVNVSIKGADVAGDNATVYHVDGKNANKVADARSGNSATFNAEHFSIYVVAGESEAETNVNSIKIKIQLKYENGVSAFGFPYTMIIEETETGFPVEYELPIKNGYTLAIQNKPYKDGFSITDGKLEGTIAKGTTEDQMIDVVYLANASTYTVKHLYEKPDGTYQENQEQRQSGVAGKVGTLTSAEAKTVSGYIAQPIAQEEIQVGNNTVVEVKYDLVSYTLTYNPEGGSYVPSVTAKAGTSLELAKGDSAPIKTGYTFAGWTDGDGKNVSDPFELNGDTVLHAKWTAATVKYKIVYMTENADDDGYSYAGTVEATGKTGAVVTANSNTTKPSGFDTTHFTFKESTTETLSADGSTVITVKYSRNTYTITFLRTGDRTLVCTKNEHSHRWNCYNKKGQLTCNKEAHSHSDDCYKSTDLIIEAKYQANIKDQWNAAVGPGTDFEGNNWSWTSGNRTYYTGFQATMPGYYVQTTAGEKGSITRNLYYYVEDPSGTITYNGKTFKLYTQVTLNLSRGTVPTYEEEFFKIDGYDRFASTIQVWKDGTNGGNNSGSWDSNGGGKFYYTRAQYSLELINGDKNDTKSCPFKSDISGYLGEPSYNPLGDGKFEGWYLDPSFQNEYKGDKTMPKGLVLYAKWSPVQYTVDFKIKGEDGEFKTFKSETINSKGTVSRPYVEPKEGYDFKGWYTDEECTQSYDFANQITNKTILYGKYDVKHYTSYTVKYIKKGSDPEINVEPSKKVDGISGTRVKENAAIVEGYAVKTPSQSIILDADPTKNVIVFEYEKVESLKYTVKYVCGDTTVYTDDEQTTDASYLKIYADTKMLDEKGYKPAEGNYSQYVPLTTGENIITFYCVKGDYDIEYKNVDGATWNGSATNPNPTKYTYGDEDFTLIPPEKENEAFIGWEFTSNNGKVVTNDHSPENTVISEESHGDLQFTACWAKLTATGYEGTYDGHNHSVTDAQVTGADGYTISYRTDGETWKDTAPSIKDVGTITVYVKATKPGYKTLNTKVTLKVTPKPVTITAEAAEKVYGSADPKFKNAAMTGQVEGELGNIDLTVIRSDAGTDAGEKLGKHEGVLIIKDSKSDLEGAYTNYTFEIKPANFTIKTNETALTVSAANVEKVYDGNAYGVTATASLKGATIKYKDADGNYTLAKSPTRTNVGTTTVEFQATLYGYKTVTGSATVKIKKRPVTITAEADEKAYGSADPKFKNAAMTGQVEGEL
ncbi:MAG: InlB B-repeat-containing protein, partial [Bacillota bacterium]|nr:InlB B-repeat-containing protein [Bacillota bacterium]